MGRGNAIIGSWARTRRTTVTSSSRFAAPRVGLHRPAPFARLAVIFRETSTWIDDAGMQSPLFSISFYFPDAHQASRQLCVTQLNDGLLSTISPTMSNVIVIVPLLPRIPHDGHNHAPNG